MDNLSFSIEEEDVKNYLKNVGDITEVHFDTKDAHFVGHGHVKLTTEEAAREVLKVNNELLLDNPVRLDLAVEQADHPTTTQAAGSKILYMGNLSFAVEEDDVRDFFKDVGEIADIRFAIKDDRFLGFGHIEFTTAEAAQEALKLNNKVILDRRVKLELSRHRGGYTPGNRYNDSSIEKYNQYKRQTQGRTKTIYVQGFNSNDGFDNIRRALEKHFGRCGEVSRLSIPKDHESGLPRGVAFIDFVDNNGFNQALRLHGSEVGGCRIVVEEAKKQRGDGSRGGWSGVSGSAGESSSSRESGYGGGWWRESGGSGSRWHSEGYTGGGWGGGSDSGRGGDRASGYGYSGGWRSGSGVGGKITNSRRVGGGSGDRWSGYSGSGYSSRSSGGGRVGSFRFRGGYSRP